MGSIRFLKRVKLTRGRLIILMLLSIAIITSTLLLHPLYFGVGLVEDNGGFCFVTEPYGPNDNVSYTVEFHDVEFEFLYWYYPPEVYDAAYSVFFNITFLDGTIETLTIATGSWWFTSGGLKRPLFGVTTLHTSPTAGILVGDYLDSPVRWQFTVSIT